MSGSVSDSRIQANNRSSLDRKQSALVRMDEKTNTGFVKGRGAQEKRDKLTVRAGFTTKALDNDSPLLVLEVLER
jgi:hypothetical protein